MQTQHLGSGSCFDVLQVILDQGRDQHKSKAAAFLQKVRLRIRALDAVPSEYRPLFLDLLREKTLSDVDAAKFLPNVTSHLRCCVVAVFRQEDQLS